MADIVTIDGHVATLDPAAAATWAEFHDALYALVDLPEVRAVLVRPGDASHLDPTAADLYALERVRVPTVTWFEGETVDAALGIALACDVRVAAPGATIRFTDSRAASRSMRRMQSLLFDHEYAESLLATEASGAEAALSAGLVSQVADDAGEEARRIAGVIASRGPIATSLAKEAVWRGLALPLEQALRTETDLTMLLISTKDRAEGVAAFLEKRQPEFTGE